MGKKKISKLKAQTGLQKQCLQDRARDAFDFVDSCYLTGRPWQFARSNVAETPLLLILSPALGKAEPTLNLR